VQRTGAAGLASALRGTVQEALDAYQARSALMHHPGSRLARLSSSSGSGSLHGLLRGALLGGGAHGVPEGQFQRQQQRQQPARALWGHQAPLAASPQSRAAQANASSTQQLGAMAAGASRGQQLDGSSGSVALHLRTTTERVSSSGSWGEFDGGSVDGGGSGDSGNTAPPLNGLPPSLPPL
jgi:hypothetical protein